MSEPEAPDTGIHRIEGGEVNGSSAVEVPAAARAEQPLPSAEAARKMGGVGPAVAVHQHSNSAQSGPSTPRAPLSAASSTRAPTEDGGGSGSGAEEAFVLPSSAFPSAPASPHPLQTVTANEQDAHLFTVQRPRAHAAVGAASVQSTPLAAAASAVSPAAGQHAFASLASSTFATPSLPLNLTAADAELGAASVTSLLHRQMDALLESLSRYGRERIEQVLRPLEESTRAHSRASAAPARSRSRPAQVLAGAAARTQVAFGSSISRGVASRPGHRRASSSVSEQENTASARSLQRATIAVGQLHTRSRLRTQSHPNAGERVSSSVPRAASVSAASSLHSAESVSGPRVTSRPMSSSSRNAEFYALSLARLKERQRRMQLLRERVELDRDEAERDLRPTGSLRPGHWSRASSVASSVTASSSRSHILAASSMAVPPLPRQRTAPVGSSFHDVEQAASPVHPASAPAFPDAAAASATFGAAQPSWSSSRMARLEHELADIERWYVAERRREDDEHQGRMLAEFGPSLQSPPVDAEQAGTAAALQRVELERRFAERMRKLEARRELALAERKLQLIKEQLACSPADNASAHAAPSDAAHDAPRESPLSSISSPQHAALLPSTSAFFPLIHTGGAEAAAAIPSAQSAFDVAAAAEATAALSGTEEHSAQDTSRRSECAPFLPAAVSRAVSNDFLRSTLARPESTTASATQVAPALTPSPPVTSPPVISPRAADVLAQLREEESVLEQWRSSLQMQLGVDDSQLSPSARAALVQQLREATVALGEHRTQLAEYVSSSSASALELEEHRARVDAANTARLEGLQREIAELARLRTTLDQRRMHLADAAQAVHRASTDSTPATPAHAHSPTQSAEPVAAATAVVEAAAGAHVAEAASAPEDDAAQNEFGPDAAELSGHDHDAAAARLAPEASEPASLAEAAVAAVAASAELVAAQRAMEEQHRALQLQREQVERERNELEAQQAALQQQRTRLAAEQAQLEQAQKERDASVPLPLGAEEQQPADNSSITVPPVVIPQTDAFADPPLPPSPLPLLPASLDVTLTAAAEPSSPSPPSTTGVGAQVSELRVPAWRDSSLELFSPPISSLLASPGQAEAGLSSSPAQAHQHRADTTPEPPHPSGSHLRSRPPPHARHSMTHAHPPLFPHAGSALHPSLTGSQDSSAADTWRPRSSSVYSMSVPQPRRKLTAHCMDSDDDSIRCPKPANAEPEPLVGATDDEAGTFAYEEQLQALLEAAQIAGDGEGGVVEEAPGAGEEEEGEATGVAGLVRRSHAHSDPTAAAALEALAAVQSGVKAVDVSSPQSATSAGAAGFSSPRMRMSARSSGGGGGLQLGGPGPSGPLGSPLSAGGSPSAVTLTGEGSDAEDLPMARARRRDWLRRKSKKHSISFAALPGSAQLGAADAVATAAAQPGSGPAALPLFSPTSRHWAAGAELSDGASSAGEESDDAAELLDLSASGAPAASPPNATVGAPPAAATSAAPGSRRAGHQRSRSRNQSASMPTSPLVRRHARGLSYVDERAAASEQDGSGAAARLPSGALAAGSAALPSPSSSFASRLPPRKKRSNQRSSGQSLQGGGGLAMALSSPSAGAGIAPPVRGGAVPRRASSCSSSASSGDVSQVAEGDSGAEGSSQEADGRTAATGARVDRSGALTPGRETQLDTAAVAGCAVVPL